ncbi:hypothetical protein [Oleiagrimonas soli]|uniref:Transmembrane protein n=1 Tax=Oleiagrimonas soli TaxID=1543381 RepID=A0A099CSD2_9GAMM|nr:hypothetical protein [Oleiagrimonas soli]KGI76694.1 hypothetical protein LF63_0114100 [Oleiagrimonas soli]MBB6185084.1 hypothetical protein [Oleiagrimonas soli]
MIARSLAGVLLGFPLAGALLALLLEGLPEHGANVLIPALLLFFPLWTALMIATFLFRHARRAWFVLGACNLAAFAALALLRMAGS